MVLSVLWGIALKIAPYLTFGWLFSRMDMDFTLWFYEKFGRSTNTLKGKIVWITGSSSGIGEGLAYCLAKVGCKLIISGTRANRLIEVKRKCLALNSSLTDEDVLTLAFDITDLDNHKERFDKVIEHFGGLDILVNNAGRSQRASFEDIEIDVDREMFEVNVFGLIKLTRLALRYWYDNNQKGHLVVTSSTAGKVGAPFSCTYTATKHALHGYFESLRSECYTRGVSISMICPGPVFSEILGRSFTGQPGETYNQEHSMTNRRMATDRCSYLMAVTIANRLDETWISIQPVLAYYYAVQYLPSVSRSLFPKFMTKERIMKIREGN